jgi:Zn-dependent peptidase ImmA (M78 family)
VGVMTIKINSYNWEIVFIKEPSEILFERSGLCSYTENKIYILDTLTYQNKKHTLTHELTHAFEYSFGLRDRKSESEYEDLANFVELYGEQIIELVNKIMEGEERNV